MSGRVTDPGSWFSADQYGCRTFDDGVGRSDTGHRIAHNGRWQIAVLAKNLNDEKILTFGGDAPLATTRFYAKSNYAFYNAGRTIALQGMLRF